MLNPLKAEASFKNGFAYLYLYQQWKIFRQISDDSWELETFPFEALRIFIFSFPFPIQLKTQLLAMQSGEEIKL